MGLAWAKPRREEVRVKQSLQFARKKLQQYLQVLDGTKPWGEMFNPSGCRNKEQPVCPNLRETSLAVIVDFLHFLLSLVRVSMDIILKLPS